MTKTNQKSLYTPSRAVRFIGRQLLKYWQRNWWNKTICVVVGSISLIMATTFAIGAWYIWTERNKPFTLGTSFIADYAKALGVDPRETYLAMLDDLHVRHFRLVSYWYNVEPAPGKYDFSELDWEFRQAELRGAKITLAVGLRQPRWPECHAPGWTQNQPVSVWQAELEQYMTVVINRYKHSPALESYQLENEFFLLAFGTCTNADRQRLIDEAHLVRSLDPHHTLIISRSDNAWGWPIGEPHADLYAISIYHRVWSPVIGRYIEYPFPGWYYAFLAGIEEIWSGRDMVIHELQSEPWPPYGTSPTITSLKEQNKSFNAQRMHSIVSFGKSTGMKTIDLWGGEYWYFRKVKMHDPSVWDAAREEYAAANNY